MNSDTGQLYPVLDGAAFYGLAGEFTKAIARYSEADPVGILLHTLIGAGCLIGSGPHVLIEHSPHSPRLNALLVGATASRKGVAWSTPKFVFSQVDGPWVAHRVKSGLSSGEGMIYQVRDANGEDPGESDKRLLLIEPEFAATFKAMERQGNTLSPKIRDAWDHGTLSPLTKLERTTATNAHICIIGHITPYELLRSLSATERANGFANRFLFACVKRAQYLPSGQGAPVPILEPYFARFQRVLESSQLRGRLHRDNEGEELWAAMYRGIEAEHPGMTGAILGRGAAQVLRLSLVYSLLDEQEIVRSEQAIRPPHILAAIALWDYCKASVLYLFGDAVGDVVADRLQRAIQLGPQSDTALYELLGRHDQGRKDPALALLVRLDRVHDSRVKTAGRPLREWHAGTRAACALCVQSVESLPKDTPFHAGRGDVNE
jgi:hypothetical protein